MSDLERTNSMYRRAILVVGGAVCAIVVVVAVRLIASSARGTARIEFDTVQIDLGKVTYGDSPKQHFRFRNSGDRDVRILRILPDCNCTIASTSTTYLPSGGRGELEVTIDTATFKGFPLNSTDVTPTSFTKHVTVQTDSRVTPTIVLTLTGEVEREFLFLGERFIDFANTQPGATKSVRIRVASGKAARLLRVRSTDDSVDVVLREFSDGSQREYELSASIRKDAPKGRHFGNIVVTTSSVSMPELSVPLRGIVGVSD